MYSLYKLKFVELNPKLRFTTLSGKNECCRQFEKFLISSHKTLKSCREALETHIENEDSVFSYIIEGPEYGYGKLDYVYNEEPWPGLDEVRENDNYDASPEILLIFDEDKHLVSSYSYDNAQPGGIRQPDEHIFKAGEKAWVKETVYLEDSENQLLMPVEIVEKLTSSHNLVDFASSETLNIEKDQLIFRPLMTVTANWGECPETPVDFAPRIDFLPLVSLGEQKFDEYIKRGTLTDSFWKTNRTLIEKLSSNPDVDVRLRGGLVHAYYAGGKILEIRSRSLKVDEKYLRNYPEKDRFIADWFVTSAKDGASKFTLQRQKVMENTEEYLTAMKEVMDSWFDDSEKAERNDQQKIAMAPQPDIKIVDIEFAVSYNSHCYNPKYMLAEKRKTEPDFTMYERWPNPRFDIVGVDSEGQVYVFELKTGLDALDNMEKHVTDFVNLVGSELPDSSGVVRHMAFNEEIQNIISEFNAHSQTFTKEKYPDVNLALPPKFFFLFTHKEDKNEFWDFQNQVTACFENLKSREDGHLYESLLSRGLINEKAISTGKMFNWLVKIPK